MKPKYNPFRSPAIHASAVVFACFSLLNTGAQATDAFFIGSSGDHNLTTGTNWGGGSAAGDWDRLVFGSSVVDGTLNIDNFNGRSGITLTSGLTQDITIVNNQPLIMGAVTSDGFIDMSAATKNLTINTQYWDWSPIEWNVGAGVTLFVNGGIYENGSHSLTKNGAGNAWITAAGNRTGTTIINGGALVALRSTLGTGAVTINNGGTLYVNDQWVLCGVNGVGVAEQNVASVTVNAGGQLALDPGNGYANGATNLYLNGGSVTGGPGNASPFGGLYLYNGNEQITAGGATTSTISTILALTGNNNSITVGAGSALNITSIMKNGIFDGSAAGGFIKAGAGTLTLSGANSYTGTTTISGGTLEIGEAGTLGGGNYAGDISNGGALLYSSSANQTLSGFITGSGSITMSGSGTLTLTQTFNDFPTHYFNGAITVNSGTLIAPNEYWTLNPTSITVNGGILNMQTRPSELGYLALNGGTVTSNGVENTSFGNIILYTDTTVHAGGAAVSTISVNQVKLRGTNGFDVSAGSTLNLTSEVGEYGGAGSLSKTGSGTLSLSGANTYTGTTTVSAGALQIAGAGSLGSGSYTGAISIDTVASLKYSSSANQTFSGVINGAGSLTKDTSDSTLVLSGANTYTGATTVNAGRIEYNGTAPANSTSKITVNSGAYIYFNPASTNGTVTAPIDLNGVGNGGGAIQTYVEGGQITFSGPITLLGSSVIQGFAAGSTLNFTNAIGGTGNLTFLGNGAAPDHKDFMVLSGASNFTGDLYIENYAARAEVKLDGGDNRLPTTAVVHLGAGKWSVDESNPGLLTSSALDLNGKNQTIAGLSDSGVSSLAGPRSVVNTSGTAVTLTLNTTTNQSSGATVGGTDINGISGNNLALVKSGNGTQILSGTNTYSGNTTVTGGILSLGEVNSNNESSTVSIAATEGAKLDLAFGGIDTVDKLFINGVQQPTGNYTSSHASGAFTGGGTLHVTSGPVNYASWKDINAPTGIPGEDYDGDGVSNGVEFVLGGTKDTNDLSLLPTISNSGANMVFSFQRSQVSIDGSTTLAIQVSPDLISWPDSYNVPGPAQINNPGVTVSKDTSAGFDTIFLTVPRAPDNTKFARLVVTPAP